MKNLRLLIFPLVITSLFVFYFWDSFQGRKVICAKLEIGTIRDTVSGNVQVLAEKTFLLKSSVQGVVSHVAMQPMGKSILVDFNQTILQFDVTDLNRSLKQALMAKSHFMQRIEKGSAISLLLEIEEDDLESLISLSKADKISHSELDRKRNLVERLRTQLEHEKISNNEALINHSFNIENLQSQISGMTLNSPIKGQFDLAFF